jgi:HK97 family phage major capsid protein
MTVEELLAALQAIIDNAQGDNGAPRDLTEEEAARYEDLEKQLAVARRSQEIRKRNKAYNTPAPGQLVHPVGGPAKADDTYERAFDNYMRTGQVNHDLQYRAQGEGAGSTGGYLVPDSFRQKLIERLKAYGGIANIAEEFTTGDGRPVEWPTVDDTSNLGEVVAEAGTFSAGADIVFGTATLGAYKYMSGGASSLPLRVSVELLQDSAFDVQGYVSKALGTRIARVQASHLATGTGVGQPLGLVTGLTGTTINANTGITYDDLINYIHAVDPDYRDNARWVFNDTMLGTLQKIKDTNGDPIWRPFLNAGLDAPLQGERLLGYPVTIDQGLSSVTLSSSSVNWGAFGDIQQGYVVRRVRDVTLIVDPYTRAANGQVQFTAWARMDATQQNTNAYIALTGHNG